MLTINPLDYPWGLTDKEINYLITLPEEEIKNDLLVFEAFLELVDSLDINIDRYRGSVQFGHASEYNLRINKIIDMHLGFDNRIKNDSFLRRLCTIVDRTDHGDPKILFRINLWDEFTLDRLTADIFDAFRNILDLNAITGIVIDVKSITEPIDPNLLIHTPNVQYFELHSKKSIKIPSELYDYFSEIKSVSLHK